MSKFSKLIHAKAVRKSVRKHPFEALFGLLAIAGLAAGAVALGRNRNYRRLWDAASRRIASLTGVEFPLSRAEAEAPY